MERVKEGGGAGEGRKKEERPSPHLPRSQNTENPAPWSFFALKPHGNAGYAGW